MMGSMKFKVVLPVLNQPGYSELSIRFLYETIGDFDLIVIDNGSLLETKLLLEKLQKELGFSLVRHKISMGWAKAVNLAIQTIEGEYDYCVIVQNDCFVGKTFFSRIMEGTPLADPQAKVFLPRTSYSRSGLLQVEDEVAQRFSEKKHSNKGLPLNREQIERFLKDVYGDFQKYVTQIDCFKKLTFCQIPDSYCLIVDRQIFEEQIYFDPEFKTLGWVEREWMDRVTEAGHEPWILNNIFVHHHGNLTTDGNGFNYPALFGHDKQLYQEKRNGS